MARRTAAAPKLLPTRNDIAPDAREELVALLERHVAASLDLYSQVKQAHWNVRGATFFQLHELYDEVAAVVLPLIDLIAERATALGGFVAGTVRAAAGASVLEEMRPGRLTPDESVAAVADALAAFAASTRAAIDTADELGDQGTADLFTEVTRAIDKQLWFVEAHEQA